MDLDERLAVSLADPLSADRGSLALESTPLARQSLEILENGRDETQDRDLLLNWLTVIAENP